jgi:hypothetical protein
MRRSSLIYSLAGYLSTLPEYRNRHPEELVPMAEGIIQVIEDLIIQRELEE